MVLAHIEVEREPTDGHSQRSSSRLRPSRRKKALEPELRIINVDTKEEISADTLSVSRYDNLSSFDYHMGVIPPWKAPMQVSQQGTTFGALGSGLWDVTMYPARLFSSGGSIRSSTSDRNSGKVPFRAATRHILQGEPLSEEVREIAEAKGTKIFVHGPFDCVVAIKRDLTDRLSWLESRKRFEDAWMLIDEHPEVAETTGELNDSVSEIVATKSRSSVGESDDRASIATATTSGRTALSRAEQEKRRIGELWVGQLVGEDKWIEAAEVCGKVLHTATAWEHWAWIFIRSDKLTEITPHIPTHAHPPLSPSIYETIIKYYIAEDRQMLKEILDQWSVDLFDSNKITAAIEDQLKSGEVVAETEDWRILMEGLAKLLLASGRYSGALHCYIRLHDADTAIYLTREHRLLDAVSDDIAAFIVIRVSKEQMRSASIAELEEATAEPVKLLVSEAYTGIVPPETVVSQLQKADRHLFLFFYLRALWRGEVLPHDAVKPQRGHRAHTRDAASKLAADEGRVLVDRFADTAVELFADYDRPLLMEFLQTSTAYSFDKAAVVCEVRHFTSELIYLLSKMGQTKRALNLILSELKDVSRAISFAKSQDDPDLWEDLLDYSMDKPRFIHGLLVEVGTSIDPISLVKRIPSGLEIEGLRDGLTHMIREHDLQASISQGAAKVMQSEVARGMETLRRGQRRGIKFDVVKPKESEAEPEADHGKPSEENGKVESSSDTETITEAKTLKGRKSQLPKPGRCASCGVPFTPDGKFSCSTLLSTDTDLNKIESEILVGFACGHIFHLSHVQPEGAVTDNNDNDGQTVAALQTPTEEEGLQLSSPGTVGLKVTTARLLRDKIGVGCRICAREKETEVEE